MFLRGSRATPAHADRYRNIMAVAKGHGYAIEKHFYETEDDYINCAFKITTAEATSKKRDSKRPVIVM